MALGCRVVETLEGCSNIARHGQVDGPVFVVPAKVDAAVDLAVPVNSDGVMFLQYGD